ncbi:PDDEXK nuclease domain-containing protein [Frondihabitans peucedani]|uniref:PDDEXK nuclease domain-containing protein n=1 Tax=Frondihabitans peucedani TaxID=598626 RepID=UPI0031D7726E
MATLKDQVLTARFTAQRRVNNELVGLYWRIGDTIAERQAAEGWGAKVIARLAADLRAAFPDMKGFSPRNLTYMRTLAGAWPDPATAQQAVAQLPWGHVTVLLDRLNDQALRSWYTDQALAHGWSRNVLEHHIKTQAHTRFEAAPSNFDRVLGRTDSDLAQQITRDPYVLDFLAVNGDVKERGLEQALVDRIIDTLRELGDGFAFVGRQVHFDVEGDDLFVDLLSFHVEQLRYVVIELKTGRFKPENLGQLGFYVALVDDKLRRPQHAETVGLLLVTNKNDAVVRYSLGSQQTPIEVASYDLLPPGIQAALPPEEDLATALNRVDPDDE